MPTTEEIKGMIREVLEALKNRLEEIDQEKSNLEQEMARLDAEKSELQQLLPGWQSARSEPMGAYRA
jgi:prefoldin subunit 5